MTEKESRLDGRNAQDPDDVRDAVADDATAEATAAVGADSRDDNQDEVQDDEIIARAFRRSLAVFAIGAVIVVATVVLMRDEAEPEIVIEAAPESARSLATGADAEPPALPFVDVAAAAGVVFTPVNGAYGERLLPETMGGGVAFLDYDDDGDQDLLLVNGSEWPWRAGDDKTDGAALFRNRGDGQFDDVTAGSGLELPGQGMGVATGDYDGDGRVDVFLTAVGANRLYRNLGEGRFEEVGSRLGVAGADNAWSSSAAFFDYDRDGDLDLFVANYVAWSRDIDLEVDYRLAGIGRAYGPPTNYAGTLSWLYRNDGDAGFTEVGEEAGIAIRNAATGEPAGKALGVLPIDIDDDGWLDLAVANDTVRNFLFRNLGDGRFAEAGAELGFAFDASGSATGAMGIDAVRYGDAGDLAIAIANFANEMTSFYVAPAGLPMFSDEAIVSGVGPDSRRALSFGLLFLDVDLDGRVDLFQCNGHVENEINLVQSSQHFEQPAQLFWNCGADCARRFRRVPDEAVADLSRPIAGRGASYADIDGDGDLDLAVTRIGGSPLLLRNDQSLGHHWLRLRLRDPGGANRDALGARVAVTAGGRTQVRWVMPARSYLAQTELALTFGLGAEVRVSAVEVRWPDGTLEQFGSPPVDRMHEIVRGAAQTAGRNQPEPALSNEAGSTHPASPAL